MKLLLINSVCGIRSTGRIVTDIATEYEKKGWTCKVAYGREDVPKKFKGMSYRIGGKLTEVINALSCRLFDNDGFSAVWQTKRFIKWASSFDPDVLWLHNLHGYYLNVDLLFKWIKSRPGMKVKWTLHDCWAFTGHCSHFDYQGCDKWRSTCFHCSQKKEYPKTLFLDNSKINHQKKKELFSGVSDMQIITPSYWLAGLVKESFFKQYQIIVIHNTIDLSVFKRVDSSFRKERNLEDKIVVLGVASSWNKKKGLFDFISLSEMLDDRYVIVLVGLDRKQMERVPTNVVGIEKTNSKAELAEIYSTADVFVNATYEDNYPTVNLEAQACGTPCITYRTGGSIESVPENNVVEKGDVVGLVKRIMELTN